MAKKQSSMMKIANEMARAIIADQTKARLAIAFDAAIIAANKVFHMGPSRAADFANAYSEALDQLANKAMEPLYYEDENGNQVEDHIIVNIGGEDIKLPRISDSEVDQMYGFLKGLTSDAYFDSNVENIVAEETAAFFEGQKSAEDVAGVIQSRVQIYINENS